eukprot:350874-Chlamydomonas_euryale.AAC.13
MHHCQHGRVEGRTPGVSSEGQSMNPCSHLEVLTPGSPTGRPYFQTPGLGLRIASQDSAVPSPFSGHAPLLDGCMPDVTHHALNTQQHVHAKGQSMQRDISRTKVGIRHTQVGSALCNSDSSWVSPVRRGKQTRIKLKGCKGTILSDPVLPHNIPAQPDDKWYWAKCCWRPVPP